VRSNSPPSYGDQEADVVASLAIGAELPDGDCYMPLFVVLAAGAGLTDDLIGPIRAAIRHRSPYPTSGPRKSHERSEATTRGTPPVRSPNSQPASSPPRDGGNRAGSPRLAERPLQQDACPLRARDRVHATRCARSPSVRSCLCSGRCDRTGVDRKRYRAIAVRQRRSQRRGVRAGRIAETGRANPFEHHCRHRVTLVDDRRVSAGRPENQFAQFCICCHRACRLEPMCRSAKGRIRSGDSMHW
jgi:hypothetical protein